jgi:hypothetical protein
MWFCIKDDISSQMRDTKDYLDWSVLNLKTLQFWSDTLSTDLTLRPKYLWSMETLRCSHWLTENHSTYEYCTVWERLEILPKVAVLHCMSSENVWLLTSLGLLGFLALPLPSERTLNVWSQLTLLEVGKEIEEKTSKSMSSSTRDKYCNLFQGPFPWNKPGSCVTSVA